MFMGIDINRQKFNSKAVYQKNEISNMEGWIPAKSSKARGKTYTVYQKTFHHDEKAWKFARGALVVAATIFSLGMAYRCSKTLQTLWKQAKTGDEIRKIKVFNENPAIALRSSKLSNSEVSSPGESGSEVTVLDEFKAIAENPSVKTVIDVGNKVINQNIQPEPIRQPKYADFFHSPEFKGDYESYLEPYFIAKYKEIIANKEDSAFGYAAGYLNLLMATYFILDPAEKKQEARSYISTHGKSPVNVPVKDRIVFMQAFPIYDTSKKPAKLYIDQLIPILKDSHPVGMRPAKILFPVVFNSPNKTNHAVLLVIEPDQKNETKANITLVNTWGKNTAYKEEEDLIENAVSKAYPNCSFVKNKVRTYSGPYCGIDVIENARLLANVNDVQKFIAENRLPSRDKKTIDQCILEHAKQIEKLLKNLGKW
jgi:hypothetical protein